MGGMWCRPGLLALFAVADNVVKDSSKLLMAGM
jgi:hypothetical protein